MATGLLKLKFKIYGARHARAASVRRNSPAPAQAPRTREEIGSYLGLKLETVSRLFSRFQADGLIEVQQKHMRIIDIPGLQAIMSN